MTSSFENMIRRLLAPVDNASLVLFRIAFGLLMTWNVVRYIVLDRVHRYYLEPRFHFRYHGFEWVEPLSATGMYVLFWVMAALTVCIAIGLLYRLSMALFCVLFTYCFLIEQARYLNHYYMICLVSFLLIFVPANQALSVDARWCPRIRSRHAPTWSLWLIRAQLGIVYFFAGVAKINQDWLRGEPMRAWLGARADRFGPIGEMFSYEPVVYLASYGALLFDLLVVPFLIWRKTRILAFAVAVAFHLMNAFLFEIGVFPWMMLAATTIFFRPDWPRRFLDLPVAGNAATPTPKPTPRVRLLLAFFGLYMLIQVLLPLRHLLYPGYVSWTEEGHAFAWHMKLRDKESVARFVARDVRTDKVWGVDPGQELTDWQVRKMSGRPERILQYAHHLGRRLQAQTGHRVEVRASVRASLNGRKPQLLIDPDVDLMKERRHLGHWPWILPLKEPLR